MRLLSVDEAAGLLGVTRAAIYRWVSLGKLRPARAGSLLRFTTDQLEEFAGVRRGTLQAPTQETRERR